MLGFRLVESAAVFPARCRCGSTAGPLVDTLIVDAVGRVYVCARCAEEAAGLLGMVSAADVEALELRVGRLGDQVRDLEAQLLRERDPASKVVSVAELQRHLSGQAA